LTTMKNNVKRESVIKEKVKQYVIYVVRISLNYIVLEISVIYTSYDIQANKILTRFIH
jgi:hypothetical protein